MNRTLFTVAMLLAACTSALADTVIMRNGVTRVGTIISRDDNEVHLRITNDGISSSIAIPMSQVSRIVLGGPAATTAPASPTPTASAPAVTTAPASAVKAATEAELATYNSRGFLAELAASGAGYGLDSPSRLPAAQHELWDRANTADAAQKRGETLDTLRLLEAAMRDLPDGPSRIDAMTRRVRHEGFGTWMGRVHWDVMSDKMVNGQFDLTDVRDAERPVLIGLMKGKMASALEPLKTYFPPTDEKTGQAVAFKPAQLSGITIANALEVKEQSQLAAALLLAQLKLEPKMSTLDRAFLTTQLTSVNRILSRSRELEPQAKAALAKQQQQQRMDAEKAQRDAAINARKTAAPK